jgi:hypothetical protein
MRKFNTKISSKQYYDKKINFYNFNKIYLLKEPQRGKLDNHHSKVYLVVDKVSNCNVKIMIGRNRTKIIYEDKLKKAKFRQLISFVR